VTVTDRACRGVVVPLIPILDDAWEIDNNAVGVKMMPRGEKWWIYSGFYLI
jgi:hypothetical protein